MTTGQTPNPPDSLTNQAPPAANDAAPPKQQTTPPGGGNQAESAPASLAEDVARIIEGQADVIAQRLVYHSQTLFGVSATGVDIVNARNSVLVVANALRNRAESQAVNTLANLGDPQIAQINDATLPFMSNNQVAGLLEGLLLDTVTQAYRDDPSRIREARLLLDSYFQAANEYLQSVPKSLVLSRHAQAPGPRPDSVT
jgi:hypothetical protein